MLGNHVGILGHKLSQHLPEYPERRAVLEDRVYQILFLDHVLKHRRGQKSVLSQIQPEDSVLIPQKDKGLLNKRGKYAPLPPYYIPLIWVPVTSTTEVDGSGCKAR